MHKATLITESKDPASVASALSVDNMGEKTVIVRGKMRTTISSEKITTLLSSLDDILRCQMVAESSIENG